MLRDRLLRQLAAGWVLAPLLGWWPYSWLLLAQAWWWTALTVLIWPVLLWVPVRQHCPSPAWWAAALAGMAALWSLRIPESMAWMSGWLWWLVTGWAIVERLGWGALRRGVIVASWLAFPLWLAHHGWGWDAPLGHRALLGTLWGLASLWTRRWHAWWWAGLSCLTGSWTGGLIPLLRLLPIHWAAPNTFALALGGVVLAVPHLGERLSTRWQIWSSMDWWRDHWLVGRGLEQLPSGFQDVVLNAAGKAERLPLLDLHSTWLDVLAHGGLLGLTGVTLLMVWAWHRSWATNTVWTWLLACWVMTWQSVASHPALLMLALVWLLSLAEPRRMHVDSV